MKVYVLIHKQDSSVWDADAELFLSMEQAQEAMRNAWNEALKAWGIAETDRPDEGRDWTCGEAEASIRDDYKTEYENWAIEEKTLNVRVAIRVKGGLVQTVYSNSDVDVDVYDLDVSDFPDEGEAEEADRKEKELGELCSNPGWRAVW